MFSLNFCDIRAYAGSRRLAAHLLRVFRNQQIVSFNAESPHKPTNIGVMAYLGK